ncbi:MAG TPA: N-acetylneuraminate synthase family protein [Pyrinomonadaceae bacterium]|nr:N-acetylneuraminate synthase family protein [Pyrinomonadaceae bacterium]
MIIGEVAQSHDGSLGMAHSFIDAIADAGADAVKFQTHIAAEESTPHEQWRVRFSPVDETRYEYWRRMEFTREEWSGLKQHVDDRGLLFLSTPFSEPAIDLLAGIGMQVWKVASGEVGNIPLLKRISDRGNPVILSSGMSSWQELDGAVELVRQNGNPLAVLQCTSAYPCPPELVGLNVLSEMRDRYSLAVGLSDHSGNIYAGLAAAALGAEVLEVHVALSKEMFGPDVPASLTTTELRQLVNGVREIERMIDSPVNKEEMALELQPLRGLFTKSIVAGRDLHAGTILVAEHLKLKKPGTGLSSSYLPALLGQKLLRNVAADELLLLDDVESPQFGQFDLLADAVSVSE